MKDFFDQIKKDGLISARFMKLWFPKVLENRLEQNELIAFWEKYLNRMKSELQVKYNEDVNTKDADVSNKSNEYKRTVFNILNEGKKQRLNESDLRKMQLEIENDTMSFDEESIYKTTPNLLRILINTEAISCKDFIRNQYKLNPVDEENLSLFGQYTLEGIIVHVLSIVFSSVEYDPRIRVSTLCEQLELCARRHANSLNNSSSTFGIKSDVDEQESVIGSKKESKYPFGSGLFDFMIARDLIQMEEDKDGGVITSHSVKKGKRYYKKNRTYVVCKFDMSLLPVKLNLPMIHKPEAWHNSRKSGKPPRFMSDLTGGYLSMPTGYIYDRYRLLSSSDMEHMNIEINDSQSLLDVMNKLQNQPFKINTLWLNFLKNNENQLVRYCFLMPKFITNLHINMASSILREMYMSTPSIHNLCSYGDLFNRLCVNIQQANYDKLILTMAEAYAGYTFYLPAFLDFRGRIYRSGILHFHERELARSLIMFDHTPVHLLKNSNSGKFAYIAAVFHYNKFSSYQEAWNWIHSKELEDIIQNDENLIYNAMNAKHPFQFMSFFKSINMFGLILPITQDASASAYQIMSYLLLDETMATITNLIPSKEDQIHDIYEYILNDLKVFMSHESGNNKLYAVFSNYLNRKIVKSIYMPLIYGKTGYSISNDIYKELSNFITFQESILLTKLCLQYWKNKFQYIVLLMKLINNIGWFASSMERPVQYSNNYITTFQDYMKKEEINIYVFDKMKNKRRQVTFRVSSEKRDRKKTSNSTFVNIIHQMDALVAMNVVMRYQNVPIYTVHDNFITTAEYSCSLPFEYSNVIKGLKPPLVVINELLYLNVIKPVIGSEDQINLNQVFDRDVLHSFFQSNVPPNKLSKKQREKWNEKITEMEKGYYQYANIVCGYSDMGSSYRFISHEIKWKSFKDKMDEIDKIDNQYYCLHP